MLYHSTRNRQLTADACHAVLEGLAPDGGLYMPSAIPAFDVQECLRCGAMGMSAHILSALLPDMPDVPILVRNGYRDKFASEDLTPTVAVGDLHVLELFHGPTAAF